MRDCSSGFFLFLGNLLDLIVFSQIGAFYLFRIEFMDIFMIRLTRKRGSSSPLIFIGFLWECLRPYVFLPSFTGFYRADLCFTAADMFDR